MPHMKTGIRLCAESDKVGLERQKAVVGGIVESQISFKLPDWLAAYQRQYRQSPSLETQMMFVIEASRLNIKHETGGPFAAGVFEVDSGKMVSLGVNLVTSSGLSMLHAEMVAITLAQRVRETYDLGEPSQPALSLVTSTEPCAMCFGAIPWSGIRQVIAGASDEDARAIGFDEGPKPEDWAQALRQRDIKVVTEVQRSQAVAVLEAYYKHGGHIYNSREG